LQDSLYILIHSKWRQPGGREWPGLIVAKHSKHFGTLIICFEEKGSGRASNGVVGSVVR